MIVEKSLKDDKLPPMIENRLKINVKDDPNARKRTANSTVTDKSRNNSKI